MSKSHPLVFSYAEAGLEWEFVRDETQWHCMVANVYLLPSCFNVAMQSLSSVPLVWFMHWIISDFRCDRLTMCSGMNRWFLSLDGRMSWDWVRAEYDQRLLDRFLVIYQFPHGLQSWHVCWPGKIKRVENLSLKPIRVCWTIESRGCPGKHWNIWVR